MLNGAVVLFCVLSVARCESTLRLTAGAVGGGTLSVVLALEVVLAAARVLANERGRRGVYAGVSAVVGAGFRISGLELATGVSGGATGLGVVGSCDLTTVFSGNAPFHRLNAAKDPRPIMTINAAMPISEMVFIELKRARNAELGLKVRGAS